MPTESAFLFAGLLFLAAALGYVFARFGEIDDDEETRESTRADFLKGFRYLLNEEPDRAVDIFTGVERIGPEGLETQLALGALFRRQGQLDRALRLHQHLLERPGLTDDQREQAGFALAEDYLSAGLFDRAEELLKRLSESAVHRDEAASQLLRIAELSSDWERAVELAEGMMAKSGQSIPPSQLAHYYCELADEAAGRIDWPAFERWIARAETVAPGQPRSLLRRADAARERDRDDEALLLYRQFAAAAPDLVSEIVPRVSGMQSPASQQAAMKLLRDLAAQNPDAMQAVSVALVRDSDLRSPEAIGLLQEFIASHPVLRDLVNPAELRSLGDVERGEALERIRGALKTVATGNAPYRCSNCGYASLSLQWQCPGCRSWGTVGPVNRLFSAGSAPPGQ